MIQTFEYISLLAQNSKTYKKRPPIKVEKTFDLNKTYELHAFFINKTFISNARLKLAKIKQKLSNTPKLKIIRLLYPRYHPKIIRDILKNVEICLNQVISFMAVKMRLKMKNRSHRYNIKRLRPRQGPEYTKYKMFLRIMITKFIKQHLSNI